MLTDPPAFVEIRSIEWPQVKRLQYFCYQRFLYTYSGAVRNLRHKLRVVPADRYGDQTLCDFDLAVSPHPAKAVERIDQFGNRGFHLDIDWIQHNISFEIRTLTERRVGDPPLPTVTRAQAARFLEQTQLTAPDMRITETARELRSQYRDTLELCHQINLWVADHMRYGSGSTGVHTSAAQALATGTGLCQDYAHIMISLCRVAGIPARYVSGHMLAEGGSHAWVDVFIPDGDGLRPMGFDPTNRRQPNLGYTTIATGRDYRDIAPTSGVYSGPYDGYLSSTKRAGLTLLEYVDGTIHTINSNGSDPTSH